MDGERASIWYYPEKKIIHHQIRAFVHGEEFRGILKNGLEAFKKYGACKWLSDDRGNSAVTTEDTEWATAEWAPKVIAAGWKYWAVVMPENVIGQMNIRRWIKMYADKGVTVQVFTTPGEALAWLERR
jgi:hypothetical protein